jgi:hypothetical protein
VGHVCEHRLCRRKICSQDFVLLRALLTFRSCQTCELPLNLCTFD